MYLDTPNPIRALRAALGAPALTVERDLTSAWRDVEAVLPKSKGTWGYSIHALKYTTRGWCAVAAGARTGEWVEGFGATPVDALDSLARALGEGAGEGVDR